MTEENINFKKVTPYGTLTIHSSDTGFGIWLCPDNKAPDSGTIYAYLGSSGAHAAVYPDKEYFNSGVTNSVPFAFSAKGLQSVDRDGNVTITSLEKLATLLKRL